MKRHTPRFYTLPEVAEALGLSVKTVRRRIEMGELASHQFGRSLRVSEEDFRAYIAVRRK